MHVNPDYSQDDILKAADLYIKSIGRDYQYLQRADYFIYKRDGREEISRLSIFVEEIDDNSIQEDEWSTKLK